MRRAVAVDPVKTTPQMRGSAVRASPTSGPPGSSCSTAAGTPARWSKSTTNAAVSGVCSAGLATTALPVTRAALTWPVKIETGKFQGLMQANTPRPRTRSVLRSPVGPASSGRRAQGSRLQRVVTQEVDGLADLGRAVRHGAASLQHAAAYQFRPMLFKQVCRAFKNRRALLGRALIPGRLGRTGAGPRPAPHPAMWPAQSRPLRAAPAHTRAATHSLPRHRQNSRHASCAAADQTVAPDSAMRGSAAGRVRSASAIGSAMICSGGNRSSRMRLTKEVFAPFSSSRRTR